MSGYKCADFELYSKGIREFGSFKVSPLLKSWFVRVSIRMHGFNFGFSLLFRILLARLSFQLFLLWNMIVIRFFNILFKWFIISFNLTLTYTWLILCIEIIPVFDEIYLLKRIFWLHEQLIFVTSIDAGGIKVHEGFVTWRIITLQQLFKLVQFHVGSLIQFSFKCFLTV